jgi:hypothetical protein
MAATLMAVNEQAHVDLNDADLGDEPAAVTKRGRRPLGR